MSPLPLGEGQGEGVSTQTDLPQLLPLQGELSLTPALSRGERENEKALFGSQDLSAAAVSTHLDHSEVSPSTLLRCAQDERGWLLDRFLTVTTERPCGRARVSRLFV